MASTQGTPRTIIHVDLDAFYCSVEEQKDPALRGRAFAVGGRADERGVVASCSYAARRCGVRSAMPMALAQRLCPHLLVVAPRHTDYRAHSSQVMELLRSFTEQMEQLSIDEAFLDVTVLISQHGSENDWPGTARDLALEIQRRVLDELGLSCSLGVASNKMVAKIATDVGKATASTANSPHALQVVPSGQEAEFLAPLPVSALWGVGPKLEARLKELGIQSIGALSQWDERDLARRFGRHGVDLAQHARGIDRREVVTEREPKSISSETTFLQDVLEWEALHATLQEQAHTVAAQLQAQKLQASTVKLKLRWSDFTYSTRQSTILSSTDVALVIEEAATALLSRLWTDAAPVRLLGVGVSGLSPVRQLGLFDSVIETEAPYSPAQASTEKEPVELVATEMVEPHNEFLNMVEEERLQKLYEALSALEARFGSQVVHLGFGPGANETVL